MSIRAQQLHDKVTQGEALTAEEQVELEQWYAQEDRAEQMLLGESSNPESDLHLQHKVNVTLDQLRIVTQQIRELSDENEAVRREISELRQRLAQRPSPRAA